MTTLYPVLMGRTNVLASEHYLSAAGGARIFASGGNAIDAAVAATFVEGIVNPHLHTIGGEAPMLIYSAAKRGVVSINGNMTAPRQATIERFEAAGLKLIPHEGLLAAGVPAAFDALALALRDYGTKSLKDAMEPALELCENGFAVHAGLSGAGTTPEGAAGAPMPLTIQANADKFLRQWPSSGRLYMPDGKVPAPGTVIKNPALARCFRRLLDAEAQARSSSREASIDTARERFYRGDIAHDIVAWSQANGGLLAIEDLSSFETRVEEPVEADYRGVRVFKCPPWSQGPVFLQQLRLLEGFEVRELGHNSPAYIHLITEASKLAFADREAYYADPSFVAVPIEGLLSRRYAELRRALIDPSRASMELRPGDPRTPSALKPAPAKSRSWGGGTVHVAAADRAGNMVAITASGGWIPSSPVIEELGFPLGSRMQTFYLDRRHPNALEPGKRPRTTLSPSLAMRAGEPYMAFGTPGGDQQDQWTLQFFLNVVDFVMDIQEAIEAPKFSSAHFPSTFYPHGARPGVLRVESRIETEIREALKEKGHKIEVRPPFCEGYILAVQRDSQRGVLRAGCDPRGQLAGVMPAQVIGW